MPKAAPTTPRRLARMKEACRYGHISQSKAYGLIRAGKIDAYKDGRTTLVDLDSIDRYHASLPKIEPKTNGDETKNEANDKPPSAG